MRYINRRWPHRFFAIKSIGLILSFMFLFFSYLFLKNTICVILGGVFVLEMLIQEGREVPFLVVSIVLGFILLLMTAGVLITPSAWAAFVTADILLVVSCRRLLKPITILVDATEEEPPTLLQRLRRKKKSS